MVLSSLSLSHLVLPHMILSFRASLQSHHGPCVWPLSEKNWLTASSKKNWYKELQDAPMAAVVGRLCRLPCWLVDIPENWESFWLFSKLIFFHDHLLQCFDWESTWMRRAVAQWYWNVRQPARVSIRKKIRSGRHNAEISKPILKKQDHFSPWEDTVGATPLVDSGWHNLLMWA